ncbi:hypothetical protein N7G274_006900 [Stereocaulon virgatum]|uniref:Transmembrane protein n=1 Tax=Stereocaulon virgatum TaxID=373712 RepID=A0ABR4A7U1_9LECA
MEVPTYFPAKETSALTTKWLPETGWDGPNSAGVGPRALDGEKFTRFVEHGIDEFRPASWKGNDTYGGITKTPTLSATTVTAPDLCINPTNWENRLLCGEKVTTITFFLGLAFVCLLCALACWFILRASKKQTSEEDGIGPDYVEKLSMETQPPKYQRYQSASASRLKEKVLSASPANIWPRLDDMEKKEVVQYEPAGWRSARLVESRSRAARALATKLPKMPVAPPMGGS